MKRGKLAVCLCMACMLVASGMTGCWDSADIDFSNIKEYEGKPVYTSLKEIFGIKYELVEDENNESYRAIWEPSKNTQVIGYLYREGAVGKIYIETIDGDNDRNFLWLKSTRPGGAGCALYCREGLEIESPSAENIAYLEYDSNTYFFINRTIDDSKIIEAFFDALLHPKKYDINHSAAKNELVGGTITGYHKEFPLRTTGINLECRWDGFYQINDYGRAERNVDKKSEQDMPSCRTIYMPPEIIDPIIGSWVSRERAGFA